MGTRSESVLNALSYAFTGRHRLEGRYDQERKLYRNWDASFTARPRQFLRPRSEPEICQIVRDSPRIAAVGAGHSFNGLHLDRGTMLSLDAYGGLISVDPATSIATFKAGTRLRDVARLLKEQGLALPVLPDHNAQSLGGVLATDVHASGRPDAPAHICESVTRLRLIDGNASVREARRGEPLFRATVGGMGCTGVVVEVDLQCGQPFNLETRAFCCTWKYLLDNLSSLRRDNALVAAGYLPHIDTCIVELKNPTTRPLTSNGPRKETVRHVMQAIVQTLALPEARRPAGARQTLARFALRQAAQHLRQAPKLVLDDFEGFNRNVYQVHTEAEFAVPLEDGPAVLQEGHDLMRRNLDKAYYLLGVRMSRSHSETLVGPAAGPEGAQLAWIAPHMDGHVPDPAYDAQWRALCVKYRGRPHYGKNLLGLGADYLAVVHGANWTAFRELLGQCDPQGKFANALVSAAAFGEVRPAAE